MSIKSPHGKLDVPVCPLHRFVFDVFGQFGDRIALIDAITDKKYTFNDIISTSKKIASGLVKQGVTKGDVVAIYSYNNPEWVMMYWGIVCTGAAVTTVNPSYTKYELSHHLKDSGATYLYTVSKLVHTCLAAQKEIPALKKIIALDSDDPECVSYDTLVQDDESRWPELEKMAFDPKEDIVVILYSSGTTGLPKGVMLTHYNIMANGSQLSHKDPLESTEVTTAKPKKTDIAIAVVPFYHSMGLMLMTLLPLGGEQLVILPKFEPRPFLSAIEKYKVNMLPLVPQLLVFLAKSPLVKEYDLSSVESASCGAAPLSKDTEEEFKTKLNIQNASQGYGMTETTCAAVTFSSKTPRRPGSCGKLLAGTEAKIVDTNTGQTLGVNQRGELWLRGPQIMKGYLNRPEETQSTLDDDKWLHTGDIAYYDENEYMYIVDRMKEVIKVKGFQVPPAELEALLLQHPKVDDVGAVGVPDDRTGELPRAYVVKTPNMDVTEQELFNYAAERTAPFKHLKAGIHFIDEIPRLPSGKILRRKLKEMVINDASK